MDQRIFISYSHKDAGVIWEIAETIRKASGMDVWFDDRLRGGEKYFSVIAEQIMNRQFFVFLVSEASVVSEWCLRELEFAASENKMIVAIFLADFLAPPRVRLTIQNTNYINYYSVPNEIFFKEVQKVFLNPDRKRNAQEEAEDRGWRSEGEDIYFLDREKVKEIGRLLLYEKQGKYSSCFQPDCACLLGLAYELGVQTEADQKRSAFYYKVSRYKGSYDGKYLYAALQGKSKNGNPAELRAEMEDAAGHGSVYALTGLGEDYYYGKNGCEKDREKAYDLWKQAADAGGVMAIYNMAYRYLAGECTEKDADLAGMYALMAAEYEFPRAYRLLGYLYEGGEPFGKDDEKAIAFYEEAVRRGDYLSLCFEGAAYGRKKDFEKQKELYEKAIQMAEAGKLESGLPFFRMGLVYQYGEGVPKDMVKAVEYYLQAASRNDEKTLKGTVSLIKTLPDQKQRETFLKKAYEVGCRNAAYELGEIERTKSNAKKLSSEAVAYYTAGAESGDIGCADKLLRNYSWTFNREGIAEDRENAFWEDDVPDNKKEAIRWFQFFFAHADEKTLALMRKSNVLAVYYYAYAIELDDSTEELYDGGMVELYFKKSLEESTKFAPEIAAFAVQGYLFERLVKNDEFSKTKIDALDIYRAEGILALLETYLLSYYQYLQTEEPSEMESKWKELMNTMERGYRRISEYYNEGRIVRKDKAEARKYKAKAEEIVVRMKEIADRPLARL